MIDRGGGAIVNIGSGAGWGKPNLLAHSASKGGVFAFSQALAYDHLQQHIRVNVVVPGGAPPTGMNEHSERLAALGRQTVTGRNPTTEEVADAMDFLVSDKAAQVSGAVLTVGCFEGQGGPIPMPKP